MSIVRVFNKYDTNGDNKYAYRQLKGEKKVKRTNN